ncbi:ferredoxin [Pseudothermotoga hypogea DSM 11164 = NBRC 106472]|uniref:Ferredoxin n=1 Tax=Pseudothermotoga hypogea DSM 11164 = NBRC 106472 TaxID=1123384 RepID=A0A0X1KRR2_9THEM|nr:[Fe-Fe] hydrogenase large subunit C-terminal domain-containing protein [Pseudothermotoga hypogea]AJC73880.1 ferredoxin [Pseudothermotoga hypogea DSM 11164 = NBRC 106472]MBC7122303.1 4Fe-4S binding protein [Pseudothermotoga sp.]
MSLIVSSEAECLYCYKCLRNCPVKAISFSAGKTWVIEEECVHCGRCVSICPQKAKRYTKNIEDFKRLRENSFLVSIAPSFFAHYDEPYRVISLLKSWGAKIVQETAVGAELVSREYSHLFQQQKTIVSTACPVVVELAEKHFPSILAHLAHVDSPMTAHTKILKQLHGDLPVVFIGPCIAKKAEGTVDVALTFEELDALMNEEKVDLSQFDEQFPEGPYPSYARMYPTSGGINYTVRIDFDAHIVVEGVENLIELFENFPSQEQKIFIEASACHGGCINGPAIRKDLSLAEKRLRIVRHARKMSQLEQGSIQVQINIDRDFSVKKRTIQIDEPKIEEVLTEMGKADEKKRLNCGACGYDSCKDKAIAVLLGRAEKEMCITYLVDKLKAATHRIVEESPNAILMVKDGKIIYRNKSASNIFRNGAEEKFVQELRESFFKGQPVQIGPNLYYVKFFILPEEKADVYLLVDVTKERQQEETLRRIKKETIQKMEEMLSKQMRVVQEVAGLLGETVAEIKASFVELRTSLEE